MISASCITGTELLFSIAHFEIKDGHKLWSNYASPIEGQGYVDNNFLQTFVYLVIYNILCL